MASDRKTAQGPVIGATIAFIGVSTVWWGVLTIIDWVFLLKFLPFLMLLVMAPTIIGATIIGAIAGGKIAARFGP